MKPLVIRCLKLLWVGFLVFDLLALLAGAVSAAPGTPSPEAPSQLAVRFTGQIQLGGRPAPRKTQVLALSVRTADDAVVCGAGRVVDDHGTYLLDIPVRRSTGSTPAIENLAERCVPASTVGGGQVYLMVARGENLGTCHGFAVLNDPTTWGRTETCAPLQGNTPQAAPVSVPPSVLPDNTPATLPVAHAGSPADFPVPALRFIGQLTLAGRPAPKGTSISAITADGGIDCGAGAVYDDSGNYLLEVKANAPAGCVPASSKTVGFRYVFFANGENVGTCSGSGGLDDPTTLGRAYSCGLRGNIPASAG